MELICDEITFVLKNSHRILVNLVMSSSVQETEMTLYNTMHTFTKHT